MSDLMLHGVLRMSPDMWNYDPISKFQRYSRYVQASDLIKSQQERIAELEDTIEQLNYTLVAYEDGHLGGDA